MSILAYNGGCVVAMTGKNCVAIASDLRFGTQVGRMSQTVTSDFEKIFDVGPKLFIGFPGLVTDLQTVSQRLKFRIKMYEMREGRKVKPKTLEAMVGNLLYERRFSPYFVEPIIAGLDEKTNEPFICGFDLIGCASNCEDYAASGTCEESLHGMCETLWKPDMNPDELFEAISQSLLNAFDRDSLSGWGAVVHIIEPNKITTRKLKTRQD